MNLDVDGSQSDLIKMTEHKKHSLDGQMANGADGTREDSKEDGAEEVLEPVRTQMKQMTRLLDWLQKLASSRRPPNGKPDLAARSPPLRMDGRREDEVRIAKQANELEVAKAMVKKSEDESKEKGKTIEDLEAKVAKLNRRLQTSPLTPYILVAKRHFGESPGPHDCLCIVCGETMKAHASLSGGDSPEVT